MARPRRSRKDPRDRIMPPVLSQTIVKTMFAGFVAVISLFVISAKLAGSFQSATSTRKNFFRDPNEIPASALKKFDAILVLGGGRPTALEEPPIYVQRRCDDAAQVVFRRKEETKSNSLLPILCLSAGTAHLPQLMAANGLPIWESTSSAAYLQKRHNLSGNVYVETTSFDTIGNAFFARISHSDVVGWRNLLVVTNKVRSIRFIAAPTILPLLKPFDSQYMYTSFTWNEQRQSLTGYLLSMILIQPTSSVILNHQTLDSPTTHFRLGAKRKTRV